MNRAWKIGVNSQATAEIGSVGVAGWSGTEFGLVVGAAEGVGAIEAPGDAGTDEAGGAVTPSGAQATRRIATATRATTARTRGRHARRSDRSRVGDGVLADGVIAARIPGVAPGDPRAPIQLPLSSPYFAIACSV